MDKNQEEAFLGALSRATGLGKERFRYSEERRCFERVLPTKPGLIQGQPFYWVCNKSEGSILLGARNDIYWVGTDRETYLDVYSNELLDEVPKQN